MSSRAPSRYPRAAAAPLAAASLLVTVLTAGTAGALDLNGFMPAQGQGAVAFSYTAESFDEFWVGTMKVAVPDIGEYSTDSFTTWMTWGFTDDLALVVNLAYLDITTDGLAGFEDSGLQDGTVLAKYRFTRFQRGNASHSFLGAVGLRTPLSSYEGNAPVSLGDDTTDTLVRFIYHLENGRFYYSQQVGYDLRSDDAPEGIPIYTELGWNLGRTTLTLLYSQYFADGGTDIGDPGFTFPSNKDEYQRVGAKAFIRLGERFGVSLLGFTTLDGRNSGDTTGFSAGLSVDF